MIGNSIGPYRIREKLADDRGGTVYLALDERLDRLVALRRAPHRCADDPVARETFLADARRAAQIEHPAVSAIHELGDDDGTPFVVTALDGERTLEDELASGPMPPDRALSMAADLAEGVAAIHAKGLVHGAFTPSSIDVGPDGGFKIRNLGFPPPIRPGTSLDLANDRLVRIASPELCEGGEM